jgi:hypothetical protein
MSALHIVSGNWELHVTIEDGVQVQAVYFCGTWYSALLLVVSTLSDFVSREGCEVSVY